MTRPVFHYLPPIVLPLFPGEAGTLSIDYDLQHVLHVRGDTGFSGNLRITRRQFSAGSLLCEDISERAVLNGKVTEPLYRQEITADAFGYLELHIEATAPVFHKLLSPPGYAILNRESFGSIIVTSDQKYANPRIIDQIRATGEFCMVHTAGFIDSQAQLANSLMLINPYEKTLLARLVASTGRHCRARVAARSALVVSLEPILDDKQWATYMVAATNRVLTYDLRHHVDNPMEIYSMDHLDVFSGVSTHRPVDLREYARAASRRLLRETRLRIA